MYKKYIKRCVDFIVALIGLLVMWPVMIIVAIAVKIDSKGPAIFVSERVGKNDKPFTCYKFRSMSTTAPKACAPKDLDSDAYITKVGKFIRKTSLDELPQLYNILKGDMSFVGPRPCSYVETDLMELRKENGSNLIRPGLTGWAQINGRDVTAANVPLKAKYDGEYANNLTCINDIKIFFKTFKVALFGDGVVEGKKAKKMADKIENNSKTDQEVVDEQIVLDNPIVEDNEQEEK